VRKAGARTSGCARSSEGVGRRGPRRACAREGQRESAVGGLDAHARQREGGSESEGVGRRGPRRACARESRRESAVGGLDAPARGRVGGSRPSGASARLREGGSETRRESAVGGRPAGGLGSPRCACAREGRWLLRAPARGTEGVGDGVGVWWRTCSAARGTADGGTEGVWRVAAAATAKKPRGGGARIRDRVVWGVAGGAGLNTRVRGLG
jgi:hypothetical protein